MMNHKRILIGSAMSVLLGESSRVTIQLDLRSTTRSRKVVRSLSSQPV